MSSDIFQSQSSSTFRNPKTNQQYSRNVKKLKVKFTLIEQQIQTLQTKISRLSSTSNDKLIALKISKFCKQRNFTPQMIFRFADTKQKGQISKNDLRETLTKIGLKLSQHELTRIEYLIDEDISGVISKSEFTAYLSAFGIKKEFSSDDPLIKNALGKLDLQKIRLIAEENKKNQGKGKRKNLINYEQFLKYCHKHLPQLSNKQLAGIFNRLQRNGLIDLEQLLEYIRNRQREDAKLRDKNKQNIPNNKEQINIKKVDQQDLKTLKGKIRVLIKNRPKDSKSLFHSSQFQRLDKKQTDKKGTWLTWFRRIDRKKKGSFGYNEIIIDYIDFQKNLESLFFCFQLMGRKIVASGDKPQDIISQYNKNSEQLNRDEFDKLCQMQFELRKPDIQKLWSILQYGKPDPKIKVEVLIQAMNLRGDSKRIVYVKPNLWNTNPHDFFQSQCSTMICNPFVALRNCLLIADQLNEKAAQLWNDYQFGPTFADPLGENSIGKDLQFPFQQLQWLRTLQMGMGQFYFESKQHKFDSNSCCTHDILPRTLVGLLEFKKDLLWNKQKIEYRSKSKIKQEDLRPLFAGIYPEVFKAFARYGIYVFKFFIRERWVYVMIDNKIPCDSSGQPIFSTYRGKKYAWISLIEKAFAKVHGGYANLYKYNQSNSKLIYQLTRMVPVQFYMPRNLKLAQQKDKIWAHLVQKANQSIEGSDVFAVVSGEFQTNLLINNVQTGFIKNRMTRIYNALQIKDQKCGNPHKSHRLLVLDKRGVINQPKWNFAWCEQLENNKFDNFYAEIQSILKSNKSKVDLTNAEQFAVTNFKNFRHIFTSFIQPTTYSLNEQVILRKRIEFQQAYPCKYLLKSKNAKGRLVFSLNYIRGLNPLLQIDVKSEGGKLLQKFEMKDYFCSFQISLNNKQFKVLQIGMKINKTGMISGTGVMTQDTHFSLTFYFDNDKFQLKQRDRQILFERVQSQDEGQVLDMDNATGKQKSFILANYYPNAERGGGCCGCLG